MADGTDKGAGNGAGGTIFSFADDGAKPSGNVGNADGNPRSVDPASIAADSGNPAASGPVKRGRGRPKGSGKRETQGASAAPLDLGFVEFALLGIHTAIASATKIPEIELSQPEAQRLAVAVGEVAKYYPVAIDAKTQAWMGLIMVAGAMYGQRAAAYYFRVNAKPEPPPVADPLNMANGGIVQLRPNSPAN